MSNVKTLIGLDSKYHGVKGTVSILKIGSEESVRKFYASEREKEEELKKTDKECERLYCIPKYERTENQQIEYTNLCSKRHKLYNIFQQYDKFLLVDGEILD